MAALLALFPRSTQCEPHVGYALGLHMPRWVPPVSRLFTCLSICLNHSFSHRLTAGAILFSSTNSSFPVIGARIPDECARSEGKTGDSVALLDPSMGVRFKKFVRVLRKGGARFLTVYYSQARQITSAPVDPSDVSFGSHLRNSQYC
jgi:hypothetical protein